MSQMLRRSNLLVALGVAFVGTCFYGEGADAQGQVALETIVSAWKTRQDVVRSARFDWTEQCLIPKGHYTDLVSRFAMGKARPEELKLPPGSVIPAQDITYNGKLSLSLDGQKVRFEREMREWSMKKEAYMPRHVLTVFDGKDGTHFTPIAATFAPWPQAIIQRGHPEDRPMLLSPLILACRPLVSDLAPFDLHVMKFSGQRAKIDGKFCLEIERRWKNFVQRAWLDPSRNYVVVRYLETIDEETRLKIDIGYRNDSTLGWVPDKWETVRLLVKGKLDHSARARVTSYQINTPVDSNQFIIDFPTGTRVLDDRNPKREVNYIVKEGGAKRMIHREDLGATYQQLVDSEPGEALGKRKLSSFSWTVALSILALVAAGGLLLWRTRRLRRHQSG